EFRRVLFRSNHGSVQGLDFIPEAVRRVLICAHDITPADHVKMQAAVQRAFDGGEKVANSISKTINLPNAATVDDVFDAYRLAFETGCKGITVYRDGSREFQVLSTSADKPQAKEEKHQPAAAAGMGGTSAQAPASQPVVAVQTIAAQGGATVNGVAASANGALAAAASARPATASQPASVPVTGRQPGFDKLPGEPLFQRPVRLSGFTDQVKLIDASGEKRGFYVTVNKQDGLPTEVFIISGKGGDEANADSEALGRLVSIALQYGVPAEAIVKTLRGINGGMYGTYHGRMVASKADIIAVALET